MLMMPNKSTEVRALADCDSFFASCEVARNPALQGKEVCVCRDGDIVIACTYEAKYKGVGTGTPTREAKRLLSKNAVYIQPDMGYYGRVSEQVFSCMSEYVLELELFSIDEAFIQLPPFCDNDELAFRLYAHYLQDQIKKRTGIPVTFWVAPTRLLAKTFAKLRKPYGVFVALEEASIHETLQTLAFTKTPFIGDRMASRLPACHTMRDFHQTEGTLVRDRMGWSWLKLRFELHGVHALQIERQWPQRVISRCRSFHPHFTSDKDRLWAYLIKNFEKAYKQLMDNDLAVKYLKVFLRSKTFARDKASKRLPRATADKQIIVKEMKALFELAYQPGELYRQTGVVFTELLTARYKQFSVLDDPEEQDLKKQRILYETIEHINHKRWKQIVKTGTEG